MACRAAQLASITQMSGQVSCGSAGEYQADEPAGVARLSWRLSVRFDEWTNNVMEYYLAA